MMLKDCHKRYRQDVHRTVSPEETCKRVLSRLNTQDRALGSYCRYVTRPSGIYECIIGGTDYYQKVTKRLIEAYTSTTGKGYTKKQSQASSLLKLIERYSCCRYFLEETKIIRTASFQEMSVSGFSIENIYRNMTSDAHQEILQDEGFEHLKIRWYEGSTLNGKKILIPMRSIIELFTGTNGMAASNTLEEAILYGICDVIEHHCASMIQVNRLCTPDIDISTIVSPIANDLLGRLRRISVEIIIKDFSLDMRIPVVGAIRRIDDKNGIVSIGVATTREEALIKALINSSETDHQNNYTTLKSLRYHFDGKETIPFQHIGNIDNNNIREEVMNLGHLLERQDMKICFVNTTDANLDIPSVVVYISGAKAAHCHKDLTKPMIREFAIRECIESENQKDLEKWLDRLSRSIDENADARLAYFFYEGLYHLCRTKYSTATDYFKKVIVNINNEEVNKEKQKQLLEWSYFLLILCYSKLNKPELILDCHLQMNWLFPDTYFSYYNINIKQWQVFPDKLCIKKAIDAHEFLVLLENHCPELSAEERKQEFLKSWNEEKI